MGSESLNSGFLFSELREGREGVQFERMLRALSFVLHQWCQFSGTRTPLYGEPASQSLSVIQFDKLALFVFRLWNEMYHRHGVREHTANESPAIDSRVLTFPSPFTELPGKHGRGPARFDGKSPPIYIIDSLYALQSDGIFYFQITPPADARNNPKDHRTIVTAGDVNTDTNQFLSGFNSREIEVLREMGNGLKHLGPSEVRALGTHENCQKTREDIVKEFVDMRPHRIAVAERLGESQPFFNASREMVEYADEAWRKSKDNRRDYANAHRIMLTEIGDPDVRSAFSGCQETTEHIWDHPTIRAYVEPAENAWSFTKCLHAISIYQREDEKAVASRQARAMWKEGIEHRRKQQLNVPASEIDEVFMPGTRQIAPQVQERLINMVESITL
ncbi:MAG TPA: hypothetical protein VGO56_22050 [Pyrinomonadaceae bacterium]|jgi:hypothetical protein|nr:hypothetical protein [Pyrinomonadaceae bacterium]